MITLNFVQKILKASAILAFCSSASSYALPDNLNLEYAVSLSKSPLGLIKRTLVNENGIYKGSSESEPNMFAKLFNVDLAERCEFRINDKQYQPISYRSIRTGRKAHDRSVSFDNNTSTYQDNRKEDVDGILWDQGCFVYALNDMDLSSVTQHTIYMSDANKNRTFKITNFLDEALEVPAGNFNALRVDFQRLDKDGQNMSIWVDKDSGIPLKTHNTRDGKPDTKIELKSFQ